MTIDPVSRLRQLAATHGIDSNHDQVAAPHELAAAVTGLVAKAAQEDRSADAVRFELSTLRLHHPYDPPYGGYHGPYGYPHDQYDPYYDHDWSRYQSLMSELHYHQDQAAQYRAEADEVRVVMRQSDGPIPLMSTDFRSRFQKLQPEARSALVQADVRGNNDGDLTRKEYDDFNKKPFLGVLGKKRFEGHFGKQAHNTVLEALAKPKAINAAR